MIPITEIHSLHLDSIRMNYPDVRLELGLPKKILVKSLLPQYQNEQLGILYPIHASEINKNFDLLICL